MANEIADPQNATPRQSAMELFAASEDSKLQSLIAVGLYIEAERDFLVAMPRASAEQIDLFHRTAQIPANIGKLQAEARRTLEAFSDDVVNAYSKRHLAEAVEGAIEAAHTTKKAFGRGVAEAVVGALAWTLILVIVSVVAQRAGIDIIEIFEKASGTHEAPQHGLGKVPPG